MYALRHRLGFLVVITAAVLAMSGVAHSNDRGHEGHDGHDSPGTVKVDEDDVDDQPSNHPHVICAVRIIVSKGFGAPFTMDFEAESPTRRGGDDQRLLIVQVPDGDNVSGLVDLRGVLAGIVPDPQQGFHLLITLHLPGGGEEHKVIWVLKDCPPGATTTTAPGATTTTLKSGPTTTTIKGATTTTVASATTTTLVGGAVPNPSTGVPTQVLGESFSKSPAAAAAGTTALASTGNPLSPGLAVVLVLGGLGLLGAARGAAGRRLEATMRKGSDRER
jgi:hypothetical protein